MFDWIILLTAFFALGVRLMVFESAQSNAPRVPSDVSKTWNEKRTT